MPNAIKYSTTNVSNSIRKGNVALGTNTGIDYGPSSTTGFYNGINPPTSGYTIYTVSSGSTPTIICPQNNTEMIFWAKALGGSNINTIGDALSYMATQTNRIVVNENYPNIVTDGLVFTVDAGFVASLPISGTTWYDISGNANNGTMTNGPSYNNGLLVLDGSNDYVDLGNPSALQITGDQTIEFLINPASLASRQNYYAKAYGGEGTITLEPSGVFNYYYGTTGTNGGANYQGFTTGVSVTTNRFYHCVLVRDLTPVLSGTRSLYWYINGTLNNGTTATYSAATVSSLSAYIGQGYTTNFNGCISYGRIYNKPLSSAQVLQNYYQGNVVTSGLTMMLDAGNLVSYPTSGTSLYDLTANANHSILYNGPTFSIYNNGSLSYDGTNDYAEITGRTTSLEFQPNQPYSIFVWFKTSVTNTGALISNMDAASGNYTGWDIWFNNNSTPNTIATHFIKTWGDRNALKLRVNFNYTTNADKWQYFGVTYDGSCPTTSGATLSSVNFYLNGTLYTDGKTVADLGYGFFTSSETITYNTSQRARLLSRWSSGTWLQGALATNVSSAQIYTRALTQAEVQQNYNAQKNRFDL